jgi:hypothetical protein
LILIGSSSCRMHRGVQLNTDTLFLSVGASMPLTMISRLGSRAPAVTVTVALKVVDTHPLPHGPE